jgi:hypothetical protein
MADHIKLLTAIEYFRDDRPWRANQTVDPGWPAIESAVRQMDNFCFPIVQLHLTPFDDDEDMLNIIGGDGRYAMFHMMGEWQYVDPTGGTAPVHLWESDQGYDCLERNVIHDVEKVLRIAKKFYETGSYAGLDLVS